jgi:hypothetical protein
MKNLKRPLALLLALALLLPFCPKALAADGVTTGTATVGGTAKVVTVTMKSGRALVPLLANDSVSTDESAWSILGRATTGKVVAAINGDFFNSYYNANSALTLASGNYPQCFATVIQEGVPLLNGGNVAAIGMDYNGKVYIDRVTISSTVTLRGEKAVSLWGVNTVYSESDAIYLLTDKMDYPLTLSAGWAVVTIKDNRVTNISKGVSGYVTAKGCYALVVGPTAWANWTAWNQEPQVGETAVLTYTATPRNTANTAAWNNMRTVLSGGGVLVLSGKNVVDENTSAIGTNQDPDTTAQRSFVALLSDGRLMMGVVTSNFRAMANSLIAMGATNAIYMDGGASSMLYANGSMQVSAGRKLSTVLAIVDETSTPTAPAQSTVGTTDAPSSWAAASIQEARDLSLLPEHLDKSYQRSITRKEFCDLLGYLIPQVTGLPTESYCFRNNIAVNKTAFSDTDAYFVPFMAALGVITGYSDGTFHPNDTITRQDAAIALQRLATALGGASGGTGKTFTDEKSISSYARAGVDYVTSLGIMNGNADGSFSPKSNITREQAVVTMLNMLKVLGQAS